MPVDKNDLVFRLIKDDLTHYRLVMGLEQLGLVPESYRLNISEIVFELMEIPLMQENDPGFENYQCLKHTILKYDLLTQSEKLDKIAQKIFRELQYRKTLLDTHLPRQD